MQLEPGSGLTGHLGTLQNGTLDKAIYLMENTVSLFANENGNIAPARQNNLSSASQIVTS